MNYELFDGNLGSYLAKVVILVDVLYALNARVKSDSGKKRKTLQIGGKPVMEKQRT